MSGHDIIAIGGSASSIESLRSLVSQLPSDLPAALFVVIHSSPDDPSQLPTLLNHAGTLLALHPTDGTPIRNGCIYIAPPNYHMIVRGPLVRVLKGPRENRARPAIDPLFRSAAVVYGPRAVGLLLSGTMDDGTAGLLAIKRHGGVTMVQDPKEASYSELLIHALKVVDVDYCLRIRGVARRLIALGQQPAEKGETPMSDTERSSLDAMFLDVHQMESDERQGNSSPYSCPECGGVLWEIDEEGLLRFRCRVGHAFSPEGILAEQSQSAERALWMALKTLEERASLARRMMGHATVHHNPTIANRYVEDLKIAEEGAATIRKVLLQREPIPEARAGHSPQYAAQVSAPGEKALHLVTDRTANRSPQRK
jgi:two-component system chemotaxis response regulator CheB